MNLCGLNYLAESSQSWWVLAISNLVEICFQLTSVFTNQHHMHSHMLFSLLQWANEFAYGMSNCILIQ